MIEWMGQQFDYLNYREVDHIWRRSRPLRIMPEDIESITPILREVQLPEVISIDIFRTQRNMINFIHDNNLQDLIRSSRGRLKGDIERDLREFLVEHGYSIDPRGNFIRHGGVTIEGGIRYGDLVTAKTVAEFLMSPISVSITQTDLERLNITISAILTQLSRNLWPSLDFFAQQVSDKIIVNADVIKLAIILLQLSQMSDKNYRDILLTIGATRNLRRSTERLQAIENYLRTKVRLVPRNYERREPKEETAPQSKTFEEEIGRASCRERV